MAHASYLREKAIQLRKERELTIDELAERLALHRSTIYYWVKDVPIPRTELQTAAQRRAARLNGQKYRLIREAEYERGLEEYMEFLSVPTFREFVTMYIAEGYKRDRNRVSVANSDLAVIRLSTAWLRRLSRRPVTFSFQFHEDQDPEALRAFWGRELRVTPDSIRPQRKSNSSRLASRIWRCEHGVLTVRASDTSLRARLQAWMDCLRDEWLDSP
jgi:excisionase family DNA binding protein